MINTERLCFGCMNDNGGEKICPVCGFDSASKNPEYSLPIKFILANRYLVGKIISATGEAMTYIGWDNVESVVVEIKEYFPAGFAHRNPDKTVSMVKGGEYTFNQGLIEFAEINSSIIGSELPSLVPVSSVFEENGTVYAVSAHIAGITLEQFLNKNGGALKWEQARALFLPLIDTIKGMNELRIIHRGISPENIIVGRDGKLRIKDYSIKKFRTDDSELEAKLYPGYSPLELYGFDNMVDGSHTDVYGLCATLFRVLIGVAPPAATQRVNDDSMTIPSKFAEELPRHVLAALANGLQVLPENRTKNIEALKNELVYAEIAVAPPVRKVREREEVAEKAKQPTVKAKPKKNGTVKYVIISAISTALIFTIIVMVVGKSLFGNSEEENKKQSSKNSQITSSATLPDVEEGVAGDNGTLFSMPDFKGLYYANIYGNNKYEMFEFSISDKNYSDTAPKGTIISQSVEPDNSPKFERGTKISFVISLGKKEIVMPRLIDKTADEAILELLKCGFSYEFINSDKGKDYTKSDEEANPNVVILQYPEAGTLVSPDIAVEFYINSYTGEEEDSSSNEGSSQDEDSSQDIIIEDDMPEYQ